MPGASDSESGVFLFHTYGGKSSVNASAYNYGVFASGSQPAGAGTPFVPTQFRAFDYSCFVPDDSTVDGLGIATSHGVTQFGCCAKTGAGPDVGGGRKRRILFSWQQNGNSGGDRLGTDPRAWSNSSENTMTLPRDLSWGAGGAILQRFVSYSLCLICNFPWVHANLRLNTITVWARCRSCRCFGGSTSAPVISPFPSPQPSSKTQQHGACSLRFQQG